jgi:hypothetical protein
VRIILAGKKKKKGNYGNRYSEAFKAETVKAWHEEKWASAPRPKYKFVSDAGITGVTLDKWLAEFPYTATDTNAGAASTTAIVIETAPVALTVVGDSFEDIVEAIRIRQAEIAGLKDKLRTWIDGL